MNVVKMVFYFACWRGVYSFVCYFVFLKEKAEFIPVKFFKQKKFLRIKYKKEKGNLDPHILEIHCLHRNLKSWTI